MGYQGPWNQDTDLRPKKLIIFGNAESCPECQKWIGSYAVTPSNSLDQIMNNVPLPPFHPNCDCNYRIEYENAESYMTPKQAQEVLSTFRAIRDHYAAKSSPGLIDNYLLLLPFIDDIEKDNVQEILADWEKVVLKSCGARAGELKLLYMNYLQSRKFGTSGCKIEVRWNVDNVNSHKEAFTAHAWVRFHFQFIDSMGRIKTQTEDFDAWWFSGEEWLKWLSIYDK